MLVLKSNETCMYGDICPFSNGCYGLKSNRGKEFKCEFISFENGKPCFNKDDNLKRSEFPFSDSNKKILHG